LPEREEAGVRLKVLAGTAFGMTSPVKTLSPLFYVDVVMAAGTAFSLPVEHAERALYVVDGAVDCGAGRTERGRMLVFVPGASVMVRAEKEGRFPKVPGDDVEFVPLLE
jgi:redox-sensitive bicupin YhaK (pirin superfamily)